MSRGSWENPEDDEGEQNAGETQALVPARAIVRDNKFRLTTRGKCALADSALVVKGRVSRDWEVVVVGCTEASGFKFVGLFCARSQVRQLDLVRELSKNTVNRTCNSANWIYVTS